jgi:Fe-S cluster assembly iron-binding protein IscA
MLELSDAAAERMRKELLEWGENENECFRIAVADDNLELVQDEQRPDDVAFEHEGKVILVLDSDASELLKDSKIDFDEEESELFFVEPEDE